MKNKLSVVISAFNEEMRIEDCLRSVDFADEIIFIDNSSTDRTLEIAKKYTKKNFTRENYPMLNINKNFGFTKAVGDWILYLDADEIVSDELKTEIQRIIQAEINVQGYQIPRKNIIFGKWVKHSGWYPDFQMRLFRKDFGKFEEKHVHEMIVVNGPTGYLKEHLLHNNYESISQFLYKTTTIYAPNEAKELLRKGYGFDFLDAIRFPMKEFLSRFFAREGYKDGFHGLILSMLMAFYHFIVFCLIWEQEKFKEANTDMLSSLKSELNIFNKDLRYWFYNEKQKTAPNIFQKLFYKIKIKLN